ncbi:MAG: hypothetical protein AAF629_32790 [Chloroflexota bacterium]
MTVGDLPGAVVVDGKQDAGVVVVKHGALLGGAHVGGGIQDSLDDFGPCFAHASGFHLGAGFLDDEAGQVELVRGQRMFVAKGSAQAG